MSPPSRLFRRLPCPPRQHRQLSQRVLFHYHRIAPPPPPRLRPVRLSPAIIIMAEDLPHHCTCEFVASFPGTRCYLLFAHLSLDRHIPLPLRSIVIGSPFSQRYSYCYSSRLPSSFARSSCADASGGASKRLSSRASLHLLIRAARVAVVLSARSQSCGRPGWPMRPMMDGTLSSYVYALIFVSLFPLFPSHHLSSRDLPPSSPVSFERIFVLTFDVYRGGVLLPKSDHRNFPWL